MKKVHSNPQRLENFGMRLRPVWRGTGCSLGVRPRTTNGFGVMLMLCRERNCGNGRQGRPGSSTGAVCGACWRRQVSGTLTVYGIISKSPSCKRRVSDLWPRVEQTWGRRGRIRRSSQKGREKVFRVSVWFSQPERAGANQGTGVTGECASPQAPSEGLFAGEIQAHGFTCDNKEPPQPSVQSVKSAPKRSAIFPPGSPTSAIWFSILYFFPNGMSTCNVPRMLTLN